MLEAILWMLLFLFLLICGAFLTFAPKATIQWDRKINYKLGLASKKRLDSPIPRWNIILLRILGFVYLMFGLVGFLGICIVFFLGVHDPTQNMLTDQEWMDFKVTAVIEVISLNGLGTNISTPKLPKELYLISAKYGAKDSWIDVTEQVRKKIHDNLLRIEISNALAGDPIYGVPKTLEIKYIIDGEHKSTSLKEGTIFYIPDDPFDELKFITTPERLISLAKACPAEVGFYGKNFTTGKVVEYRPDQPACLASIVKLFALLEVMRQTQQGTLDLSSFITIEKPEGDITCTLTEAIDKMIGISDNEATAALARPCWV